MGGSAVKAAEYIGYTSAGTVELIDTAEALKEEFRKELDEINERIDELREIMSCYNERIGIEMTL